MSLNFAVGIFYLYTQLPPEVSDLGLDYLYKCSVKGKQAIRRSQAMSDWRKKAKLNPYFLNLELSLKYIFQFIIFNKQYLMLTLN